MVMPVMVIQRVVALMMVMVVMKVGPRSWKSTTR